MLLLRENLPSQFQNGLMNHYFAIILLILTEGSWRNERLHSTEHRIFPPCSEFYRLQTKSVTFYSCFTYVCMFVCLCMFKSAVSLLNVLVLPLAVILLSLVLKVINNVRNLHFPWYHKV